MAVALVWGKCSHYFETLCIVRFLFWQLLESHMVGLCTNKLQRKLLSSDFITKLKKYLLVEHRRSL